MSIKIINEGFKRLHEAETVKPERTPYAELAQALDDAALELGVKQVMNIKAYEIAFQEAIERVYPDKAWWEVTGCDIFQDLFMNRDIQGTIDNILANMKVPDETEEVSTDTFADAEDGSEFEEALEECLSRLTEAEVSDEDRQDSDLIRSMLSKMQQRSNAAFTPEEKAVLDKYGITRDNWSRNLSVDGRDLDTKVDHHRSSSYHRNQFSNGTPSKINYADRARKLRTRKDSQLGGDGSSNFIQNREMNAHGQNRSGDNGYQGWERGIAGDRMKEPVRRMKHALSDRKYGQNQLDTAASERASRISAAELAYKRAIDSAESNFASTVGYGQRRVDFANAEIDKLLKREDLEG